MMDQVPKAPQSKKMASSAASTTRPARIKPVQYLLRDIPADLHRLMKHSAVECDVSVREWLLLAAVHYLRHLQANPPQK